METRGFFGYSNIYDVGKTLGITYEWLSLKLSLITIASLTTFITTYIYNDAQAIFILFFLFGADLITGVWKSFINKNFSSYKLFRILPMFVAAMFILSISWHLSTVSWVYGFLPSIVYIFISSTLFVSLIENLGEIGILDKVLINTLRQRFNFKTLLKKVDAKKDGE